ncbi:exodeoxyribonuclease VII large subunit [Gryllotalpicola sp.]|uniref:exodeoxyribonuclease VII large subunit n=1 Tax=Gryllotalpicola sp. TaxID=1932787 RepID=UPI002617854C|nr:exodeoxyribonuclease VII large subunit [Gryllotalpicola sp.]
MTDSADPVSADPVSAETDARTGSAARSGAATAESPWPVARLGNELHNYIARLGAVWVEGELTQWNDRRGNVYAKLKDLEADVYLDLKVWSSTAAKLADEFKAGDRIVALVKPDYWVAGGQLSMIGYELRHVGLGDLLERLERLRRQLAGEGLFDASRRKRLPFLPHLIGLVTGRDSDAEKDVKTNARLRWPEVQFRTVYTAVQGERAAAEVTAAIRQLDADPEVDVIIVARGGGDFLNLLPFSDETLVRAAAALSTPLVSAIGHEADRPLLDEVASLRASTPTDAAKRVVPDVEEERALIAEARARMHKRLLTLVATEADRIAQLRSRPALQTTGWIVDSRAEDLARWVVRGSELANLTVERAEVTVRELAARLRTLSPKSTLERGYAIVQAGDRAVRTVADAPAGAELSVTVADGAFAAESRGQSAVGAQK